MPGLRNTLLSYDTTPDYNCVTNCLQGAFIGAEDGHRGCSFECHRGLISMISMTSSAGIVRSTVAC